MNKTREKTLQIVKKMGYEINPALPLIDDASIKKNMNEVTGRICILHAFGACSYGFPVVKAKNWINIVEAYPFLTEEEKNLLEHSKEKKSFEEYQDQIEALWALCWIVSYIKELDFQKYCSDNFVDIMPDIRKNESFDKIKIKLKFRTLEEIIQKCDLAYCLHWAIVDERINNKRVKHKVDSYTVIERRHALEWILSEDNWDNVNLDT